jgi:dTDP-4-dehydrorhamnose 3,5-epimerase
MNVEKFEIPDLLLLEPRVFNDERGYFLETYNAKAFADIGIHVVFVQDNVSLSKKGVIRGLHFQKPPYAQDKLVRVVRGEVLDVAVDLRVGSPTYGKHQSVILSESNKKMLFIPKGFAHGFCVLSDEALFEYKVSAPYHPECEGGIIWNDADLAIDWKTEYSILGEKDQLLPAFKIFESPFVYGE